MASSLQEIGRGYDRRILGHRGTAHIAAGLEGGTGTSYGDHPKAANHSSGSESTCSGLRDLSVEEINYILDTANGFEQISTRSVKKAPPLRGKVVVNLFFEDSTRTRDSFSLAASRLSADVMEFTQKASSVSKGETLLDTARNLEAMGIDIVVIRHSAAGVPMLLSRSIKACVVNAGDGYLRAPDPGPARRLHDPQDQRLARRPQDRHRRRHRPLPRRPQRPVGHDQARAPR